MSAIDSNVVWSLQQVSASTFDDTSNDCIGSRCKPSMAVDDGYTNLADDLTVWQSQPDPLCRDQWLSFDWSQRGTFTVSSFLIQFGPAYGNVTSLPDVRASIVNEGWSGLAIACNTSYVADTAITVKQHQCAFVDAARSRYLLGMNLSFHLVPPAVNKTCFINVAEVIVMGSPSYPWWNPFNGLTLSPGAIAAIVVVPTVIIIPIIVLLVIRARNLEKRRQRNSIARNAANRASRGANEPV
ncbi:hypothetical protein DFJ73DRAFT_774684 [Zopfochytrium polystomum]|nr:hypothetical protein DFJ73DRAFT_774684 [Zopfochytrium polystomum]